MYNPHKILVTYPAPTRGEWRLHARVVTPEALRFRRFCEGTAAAPFGVAMGAMGSSAWGRGRYLYIPSTGLTTARLAHDLRLHRIRPLLGRMM
jgi:hypothetical protein